MKLNISLKGDENISFWNNVDFCVGTGRAGLALTEEYLKELSFVQDIIGFKHIRGHGLFTDDLAIYQKRKNWFTGEITMEYNFTYLDRIMDAYLERKIVPHVLAFYNDYEVGDAGIEELELGVGRGVKALDAPAF